MKKKYYILSASIVMVILLLNLGFYMTQRHLLLCAIHKVQDTYKDLGIEYKHDEVVFNYVPWQVQAKVINPTAIIKQSAIKVDKITQYINKYFITLPHSFIKSAEIVKFLMPKVYEGKSVGYDVTIKPFAQQIIVQYAKEDLVIIEHRNGEKIEHRNVYSSHPVTTVSFNFPLFKTLSALYKEEKIDLMSAIISQKTETNDLVAYIDGTKVMKYDASVSEIKTKIDEDINEKVHDIMFYVKGAALLKAKSQSTKASFIETKDNPAHSLYSRYLKDMDFNGKIISNENGMAIKVNNFVMGGDKKNTLSIFGDASYKYNEANAITLDMHANLPYDNTIKDVVNVASEGFSYRLEKAGHYHGRKITKEDIPRLVKINQKHLNKRFHDIVSILQPQKAKDLDLHFVKNSNASFAINDMSLSEIFNKIKVLKKQEVSIKKQD